MDLAALKTELTTDPQAMGYSGVDVEDAALINAPTRSGLRELNSRELLAWAGANGRYAKIYDSGRALTHSQDVRSICYVAGKLFDREDATLDLRLEDRRLMVASLVHVRILSQDDADSLYAMAATSVSRAEELGLGAVTTSDIANARRS